MEPSLHKNTKHTLEIVLGKLSNDGFFFQHSWSYSLPLLVHTSSSPITASHIALYTSMVAFNNTLHVLYTKASHLNKLKLHSLFDFI